MKKQEKTKQKKKRKHYHVGKCVSIGVVLVAAVFLFLALLGNVAYASGLVDNTVNAGNEYSKYPLNHYQLDFYVDNSWGWLPWNWLDGIGKQVMYGLYAITNFIWTISLYLSHATGYLIQEAYSLDFISTSADAIGKNMQTLAGVSPAGFSTSGFYVGFLLLFTLLLGIYVTYTGLIKKETTKAIHAILNFVVVFLFSASFLAYAPDYVRKINDFSSDISNASLSLGTKIVLPGSKSQGKDSVDLIRDSLFSIQVKQPWLLLQYDSTDLEAIGSSRVEQLLSTSPDQNNGEDREKLVVEEIEGKNNKNLSLPKAMSRLGMVFFLFLFNIGISVFVFLLTGIQIFSQVLFLLYAMFLPISFLLSMLPTLEGTTKRAITKLFNTILTRAGITLIITVAFSISSMLYQQSSHYPFFFLAFLQVVTFAGIYFKLGDLMNLFSLQSGDSHSMGKQILRKPRTLLRTQMRHLQQKVGRSVASTFFAATGAAKKANTPSGTSTSQGTQSRTEYPKQRGEASIEEGRQKTGTVWESKDLCKDPVGESKDIKKMTQPMLWREKIEELGQSKQKGEVERKETEEEGRQGTSMVWESKDLCKDPVGKSEGTSKDGQEKAWPMLWYEKIGEMGQGKQKGEVERKETKEKGRHGTRKRTLQGENFIKRRQNFVQTSQGEGVVRFMEQQKRATSTSEKRFPLVSSRNNRLYSEQSEREQKHSEKERIPQQEPFVEIFPKREKTKYEQSNQNPIKNGWEEGQKEAEKQKKQTKFSRFLRPQTISRQTEPAFQEPSRNPEQHPVEEQELRRGKMDMERVEPRKESSFPEERPSVSVSKEPFSSEQSKNSAKEHRKQAKNIPQTGMESPPNEQEKKKIAIATEPKKVDFSIHEKPSTFVEKEEDNQLYTNNPKIAPESKHVRVLSVRERNFCNRSAWNRWQEKGTTQPVRLKKPVRKAEVSLASKEVQEQQIEIQSKNTLQQNAPSKPRQKKRLIRKRQGKQK